MTPNSDVIESHGISDAWHVERFPEGGNFGKFESALSRIHGRWNASAEDENEFSAHISSRPISDMLITRLNSLPLTGNRDNRVIGQEDDDLISIVLVEAGVQRLQQGAREVLLKPGVLTIWGSSRPAIYETRDQVQLISLVIPAQRLRTILPWIDDCCAHPIDSMTGSGFLLASHLKSLTSCQASVNRDNDVLLADATLQLAAYALCGIKPENRPLLRRHQLRTEVLAHIRRNISDADLSPASIASTFNVSASYLHRVFQGDAFSISDHIRSCRLEACRQKLEASTFSHLTITEICFSCGFNDSAHFSRSFRKQFGMSPSQCRRKFSDRPD